MPAIDADGTPIRIKVEGPEQAPALIFSNSLGTDLHMWDEQAGTFCKDFRVVRYDQRGHGKSGAPPGPYSIERLARDALMVINHLGLAKVNWCGLSMGGMTGMWLGRHAPERIDRLVIANAAAKSQTPAAWNARISTVNAKGMQAIADAVLNVWFSEAFRKRAPEIIKRMRAMLVATDPRGYVGCCAGVRDVDQRWGLHEIKLPTLVICGRHDPAVPLEAGEAVAASVGGARLSVLDAAHISNIEQSAAFTDALAKFLGKG
jgi:3-oxoadipate enol-lactonase